MVEDRGRTSTTESLLSANWKRSRSCSCGSIVSAAKTAELEAALAAQATEEPGHRTGQTTSGGCFLLCNIIVGAGLLNMPYTFRLVGWDMILVMVGIGWCSMLTAGLIGTALTLVRPAAEADGVPVQDRDWGYLAEFAYGMAGRRAAQVCYIGELGTYILSFMTTVAKHATMLSPALSTEQGLAASVAVSFLLSYVPLHLLSQFSLFAHLSFAVAVVCMCITVYADFALPEAPSFASAAAANWDSVGVEEGLPYMSQAAVLCVYSWAAHSAVPTVAGALEKPSNIQSVVVISHIIAIGSAMFVGLLGYLAFGLHTQEVFTGNLGMQYWSGARGEPLSSYAWMNSIATASVLVKISLMIPCFLYPITSATEVGVRSECARALWRILMLLTLAAGACAFGDKVAIAVGFAGATFGNMLVFVLPCIVYYGVKTKVEGRPGWVETSLLGSSIVFGVVMGTTAAVSVLRQL